MVTEGKAIIRKEKRAWQQQGPSAAERYLAQRSLLPGQRIDSESPGEVDADTAGAASPARKVSRLSTLRS
jgi:hypothetical protein